MRSISALSSLTINYKMIIKIKNIFATRREGCIGIEIELRDGENTEKKVFHLLSSQYSSLSPSKGEITEDLYETIAEASRFCDAYTKAMNILAFAPCTEKALILKLRRRGFEADLATAVAHEMAIKGYISDSDTAERELERCLAKKWGPRRITAHLHSKGYDDDTLILIEDAMENVDFGELCFELAQKKYDEIPEDPRERQKIIAALSRYGYSMSDIKYALSKF